MTDATCQANGCEEPITGRRRTFCSDTCCRRSHRDSGSSYCSHEHCDRAVRARSMCAMHYRQWERANGKANGPSSQWGPRRRANWKKRHANKRGSTHSETIYENSIYERDHWTCGICHQPVDRTLTWPNPMSVSLDHRRPLSKGGTHTRDNVQCSHFACNAKKGAKPPKTLTETP